MCHPIVHILDFSLLLLVKLSLLILFASFFVSVHCFFFDGSLSKVIALPTIAISWFKNSDSCRSFSLLKAIAKILLLLFAHDSKSVKERQLLLSHSWKSDNYIYGKQYRKEAMNQSTKLIQNWSKEIKSDNFCYRKVGGAITKWGAI